MAYSADIIADSVSDNGDRITTVIIEIPRMVWSEFLTHRDKSRNSASTRAIPTERQVMGVLDAPFVPDQWGINQPGMQPGEALDAEQAEIAVTDWLRARDHAVIGAVALMGGTKNVRDEQLRERLIELRERYNYGPEVDAVAQAIHKQYAGRLLEPFMWHRAIVTATEWENFFALRDNPLAQHEIQVIAHMIRMAYEQSQPRLLRQGEWHLPFIRDYERNLPFAQLIKMVVARCARISYSNYGSGEPDPEKDVALYDMLLHDGHMSPFEHVARPMTARELSMEDRDLRLRFSNFFGWWQHRQDIPHQENYAAILAARAGEEK